jgi:CheY-like chemotaxis protein
MPETKKSKVMVVDDSLSIRALIEALLEDDFEVTAVADGMSALVTVNSFKPDIILLDVNMPDMDGYQVCQKLKENKATRDIPVVFVSAEEGAEDQLKAYQMGGEGYITKPVNHDELLAKVQERLRAKKELSRLEEEAKSAVAAAYEAMSSNSELGIIVRFMERIMVAEHYDDVSREYLASLKELGLIVSVQIRNGFFSKTYSSGTDNEREIEEKLLLAAKENGKFLELQKRCIVNMPRISILIKNMPIENPSTYGRVKDNLSMFMHAADNRIKSIGFEMQVQQEKAGGLRSAITETSDNLARITTKLHQNGTMAKKIMQNLREEMEETLIGLCLSVEQEEKIMKMIDTGLGEMNEIAVMGEEVHEDVAKIQDRFQNLIKYY